MKYSLYSIVVSLKLSNRFLRFSYSTHKLFPMVLDGFIFILLLHFKAYLLYFKSYIVSRLNCIFFFKYNVNRSINFYFCHCFVLVFYFIVCFIYISEKDLPIHLLVNCHNYCSHCYCRVNQESAWKLIIAISSPSL